MHAGRDALGSKHRSHVPRVILDVNIYLSYLLDPANLNRPIAQLMQHLFAGSFRVVIPDELIEELIGVTRLRPYFRERLAERDVLDTVQALKQFADDSLRLTEVPRAVRDPKDDYLLAHALIGRVDYLVTGDRDLLVLDGEVDPVRIITAAAFLQLLEADPTER